MTRSSYNNSTLSANRIRTQQNRKPFIEDPEKAVFLKGFQTDLPRYQAKEYRERCYQRINKGYNVYIVKFDLPVNSADAFLHLKSVEDAQRLMGLKQTLIDENGEQVPYMTIEGDKIMVKTYKKTRKRIMEERKAGSNLTSRCSSRNPTRPVSPMEERDYNGSRYNQNPLNESHNSRNSHSLLDSAVETRAQSDNEETEDIKKPRIQRSDEEQVEEGPEIPMNILEPQPENEIQILSPAQGDSYSVEVQDSRNLSSQTNYEAHTGNFDSVTNAVENRLKSNDYAESLLRQHWVPAFDTWPQNFKVLLMVNFFCAFIQQGPEAAVKIIEDIKNEAKRIELENQLQALMLQIQGIQGYDQNQVAAGQLPML